MTRTEFRPKLAIVTGGGSGVGAAMAKALGARGSRIIIADINLELALTTKQEIGDRCEAVQLNVCNEQQVNAFFESLVLKSDIPDCLINCAGINQYGEALQVAATDWLRVLSVNLTGTALMSLAAYKLMAVQRRGTIVNMGSMATFLVDPMFNAYTTSKFGVVGFSRSLAVEAKAYGVKVHVVCPGNIATPMRGQKYELSRFTPALSTEDAVKRILRGVELHRRIIVFPFHTKFLWWIDRLNPSMLNILRDEIFRRARKRTNETKIVSS